MQTRYAHWRARHERPDAVTPIGFGRPDFRSPVFRFRSECSMTTAVLTSMPRNRVGYGLMLAFAAFAVFAWSDAFIKFLHGAINPFETAFFGAVFGLAALPFLRRRGDQWSDIVRTT